MFFDRTKRASISSSGQTGGFSDQNGSAHSAKPRRSFSRSHGFPRDFLGTPRKSSDSSQARQSFDLSAAKKLFKSSFKKLGLKSESRPHKRSQTPYFHVAPQPAQATRPSFDQGPSHFQTAQTRNPTAQQQTPASASVHQTAAQAHAQQVHNAKYHQSHMTVVFSGLEAQAKHVENRLQLQLNENKISPARF
jgi:hypothetical protein